jgi:hypothetical protein
VKSFKFEGIDGLDDPDGPDGLDSSAKIIEHILSDFNKTFALVFASYSLSEFPSFHRFANHFIKSHSEVH